MAAGRRRDRDRVPDARATGKPGGAGGLTAGGRAIRRPKRLTGERVVLRPLRESDIEPFAAAFEQDGDLGLLLGFERDPGEPYLRERLRDEQRKLREGRSVAFAIADPATDDFVGEVLLHTFDWQHARAAVGIWLRPQARRRGLGTCALRLICDYGFSELGLMRLEMTTFPDNVPTVRVAETVGFTAEGVMRSYTRTRGRRRDLTLLSLLPGELR